MTAEEIETAVAYWQDRLRLGNWDVAVNLDTPPGTEEALAECRRPSAYEEAELRFAANWRDWTAEECQLPDDDDNRPPKSLDNLIVHELLHCSFHDLQHAGCISFGLVSRDVERQHEDELDRQVERLIDRLSSVLTEEWGG